MGRNPWKTYTTRLLTERADWSRSKEGTSQAMERKLRYIGGVVLALRDSGKLSTANPQKLTEDDIVKLFEHFKSLNLKPGTIHKYQVAIQHITTYADNPIIITMRNHPVKRMKLPRCSSATGRRSFSMKTVTAFLDGAKAKAEASEDWYPTAAYGFAVLAAAFGVRPKESRAIRYNDLERYCWRLRVGYSKTHPDYTSMLPPMEGHMIRYLELRAKAFKARAMDPENGDTLMVPCLKSPGIRRANAEGFSGPQVRVMFRGLRGGPGAPPIAPKDLRTSFGQILMDNCGASLDECSQLLRHESVKTTQQFYVELRPEDMFEKLRKRFEDHEKPEQGQVHKTPNSFSDLYR
jgi:integrase